MPTGRLPENFRLDGVLDEPAWTEAGAITRLTVTDPVEGAASVGQTLVRVLADAKTLVIGVVCRDPDPPGIVSHSMARDSHLGLEDHVKIVLGTFLDGRSGYVFAVNPAGARYDALVTNFGEGENSNWDGIWEAKTSRDATGWSAEIRIPVSTLSFKKGLHTWQFNVERRIHRLPESSRWASPKRDYSLTLLSRAGRLVDLPDFDLGVGLSVRPAGVVRAGSSAPGEPTDVEGKPSLDVTQKLGPNLLASLTVNTDFAETEVDTRRINLTRFPLFFPEKRTFFLEGSDAFDFGLGLGTDVVPFHSRRIGLVNGEEVPILVGGKLNGQVGDTRVGALAVQTRREHELSPIDTETAMGVVRIKQNVLEESSAGVIATVGDPRGRDDGSWMAGGDFTYQTSHFLGDKNFLAGVWGLTMDRDDLAGGSRSAVGAKIDYPNDVWDINASYKRIGEDFDPSLGFVPRRGINRYHFGADYSPRPTRPWLHNLTYESSFTYITNLDQKFESYDVFLTPLNWDLASGDFGEFNVMPQAERLADPFEIADGVVLPPGTYDWVRYRAVLGTASKRPVSGEVSCSFGPFYDGTLDTWEASLTAHPFPLLTVGLSAEKNVGRLDEGRFREDVYGARVRLNFSPDLTLSDFAQYDTESRSVGTNAQLRWNPTPFTDVFFVVNYNWDRIDGDFQRASDEFVLKVQYTLRF